MENADGEIADGEIADGEICLGGVFVGLMVEDGFENTEDNLLDDHAEEGLWEGRRSSALGR